MKVYFLLLTNNKQSIHRLVQDEGRSGGLLAMLASDIVEA
jgi:hypothetical protein